MLDDLPPGAVGSLEDAARLAGVTTRTLQRWAEAGEFAPGEWVVLRAVRGRGHAYAISLAAAVRVAREHWTPPAYRPQPEHIPALSDHERPLAIGAAPAVVPITTARTTRDLRPTNLPPLPEGWESVNGATQRHGMKKNWRSYWKGRMQSGALPVHHPEAKRADLRGGPWWHENQVVRFAFDADGLRALGALFADKPWWVRCGLPGCPACVTGAEVLNLDTPGAASVQ